MRLALLVLVAFAFAATLGVPTCARADEPALHGGPRDALRVALVVGTNASADASLAPLHFADDDAARYDELFRQLGAETWVLSRFDENTARLHAEVRARAELPVRAHFEADIVALGQRVARAHAEGRVVEAYFLYAGHGRSQDGRGAIALEDAWISGEEIAAALTRIGADRSHVVIDACDSYLVAYSRGPGGERRPTRGFRDASALSKDPRVGLLLSTTGERASHEWERFEAGVFSHEVRSGLYGAADADGDGIVTYRELAAFVDRANAAIPSDRFRPRVYARAPAGSDVFLDLRAELSVHRIETGPGRGAHSFVEDTRGVRLADFTGAPRRGPTLVRPSPGARIYVRRADVDEEIDIAPERNVVALADLPTREVSVRQRGAEENAFSLVFSLPFDQSVVASYAEQQEATRANEVPAEPSPGDARKRTIAVGGIVVGGVALATGASLLVASLAERAGSTASESQLATEQRNEKITTFRAAGVIAAAAGGAVLAGGIILYVLTPSSTSTARTTLGVRVGAVGSGSGIGVGGTF